MRWVLPGGAVLGGRDRRGNERAVACRPRAAVLESVRPLTLLERLRAAVKRVRGRLAGFWRWLCTPKGLAIVKRVLEVLALLVGLIATILALLAGLRR
jgi:hypothetical protein